LSYFADSQTNKQTNKQTKTDKNITSLAEVMTVNCMCSMHLMISRYAHILVERTSKLH